MAYTLTALSQLFDTGFDTVIDVRSPSEWAEDHLPGAINLPVLDVDGGYLIAPMTHGIRLTTGAEFAERDAPPSQ